MPAVCAVELLPSKLQVRLVHEKVKFATGAGSVALTFWLLLLLPPASLIANPTRRDPKSMANVLTRIY